MVMLVSQDLSAQFLNRDTNNLQYLHFIQRGPTLRQAAADEHVHAESAQGGDGNVGA